LRKDNAAFLDTDFDVHAGYEQQLEDQRLLALTKLQLLFAARQLGVAAVRSEIESYRHVVPVVDPSLAASLALYALKAAGALIGAQVGAAVAAAVGAALGGSGGALRAEHVVAILGSGLREMFKEAGKAQLSALAPTPAQKGPAETLSDTAAAFLAGQSNDLIDDADGQASFLITEQHTLLLRHLAGVKGPAAANRVIGVMAALANALEEQRDPATTTQAEQSRSAWLRLLAHASVGSKSASTLRAEGQRAEGERPVMDASAATGRFAGSNPAPARAGLIDVFFEADYREPRKPIVATRVRLTGVSRKMLQELQHQSLLELAVPVRAIGTFGGPTASVTLVRDEIGNVAFTDNTADAWQRATWLSRVAGTFSGTVTDQTRGARLLLDQLMKLKLNPLKTENDSDAQ